MADSGYIRVSNGKKAYPLAPHKTEFDIEVIAHALGMLCRFGGHTEFFYSVAEHSVLVSRHVPAEFALWGLLHDASEAFLGDVVRPLKHSGNLQAYIYAEAAMQMAIARKFGLVWPMPPEVKQADNNMLITEMSKLIKGENLNAPYWKGYTVLEQPLGCLPPRDARMFFLDRFKELTA